MSRSAIAAMRALRRNTAELEDERVVGRLDQDLRRRLGPNPSRV
jgi:hypothetical protein